MISKQIIICQVSEALPTHCLTTSWSNIYICYMAETPWGLDATESVKLIAMGKIVNILPSIARPTARPASSIYS